MTYTTKCPYCGAAVKGGHGAPWKRIGSPIKRCRRCYRDYIDNDVYEWNIIGIGPKLWFYFFANNRFVPWVFLLITVPGTESWLYFGIGAALWIVFCVLWVRITKKEQIAESKRRTTYNPEYIKLLSDGRYDKIAMKYDPFYTQK